MNRLALIVAMWCPLAGVSAGEPPPFGCGNADVLAWGGMAIPGGGLLGGNFPTVPTTNALGQVCFASDVLEAAQDEGVFVADDRGLRIIALGCTTSGATCGDPTPLGGTFADIVGTQGNGIEIPVMNDLGDVLFSATIEGGSASGGLFLYRAATGLIEVVAAEGQPTPGGGVFANVNKGMVNNSGTVVFRSGLPSTTELFLWNDGVVTQLAAAGDPAPGGGNFTTFSARPSINNAGQVACRASTTFFGGPQHGVLVTTNGVHEWYAQEDDPAPAGGTYTYLRNPILNDAGDVAFTASISLGHSAWITGQPGSFRVAITSDTVLPDGTMAYSFLISYAVSSALDDDGNIFLWARDPSMTDRVILAEADGNVRIVMKEGDATPFGGVTGSVTMPCMGSVLEGVFGGRVDGVGTGARWALYRVGMVPTWKDLGFGFAGSTSPQLLGQGSLQGGLPVTLTITDAPASAFGLLFAGLTDTPVAFKGGTLVPSLDFSPVPVSSDESGQLELAFHFPQGAPQCTTVVVQAWFEDTGAPPNVVATNAIRGTTP
jgi:hypothetical protein